MLGVTPALVARIADSLTVYSRQPGINPATATRDVLLAIPNATPEAVDAYIAQRTDALANKLPVPPLPQAQGFAAGAAPVWRIRAEATMPDGVTFVRDAVLRPSVDPRRPVIALLWQEGARTPPQPANADGGVRMATDNEHGQRSPLTFGNGCANPRTSSACPRSGAGGRRSSRRSSPRRRARRLKRRLLRPVLAFAPDVAVLWVPRTTNGTLSYAASARIPLAGDAAVVQQAGRAVIDALPQVAYGAGPRRCKGRRCAAARVRCCASELRLPAAVEQDLKQALAYDLDRHTPFKPDELYFDAAVVGRDAAKGRDTRRLGGGAAQRGDGSAPARGELGSDGRRRHAGCAGRPTARRRRGGSRLNLLPDVGAPGRCVVAPLAALGAARARRGRRC